MNELVAILGELVQATRTRLSEARPADGLKAAEMLAKMCGWNEPERVNVQSVEVKVDAALIEQLRAGYTQLSERERGQANGPPLHLGGGPPVGPGREARPSQGTKGAGVDLPDRTQQKLEDSNPLKV
jgi:hypothetical protein